MLSIALLAVIGFTSCKSEKKEEKPAVQTEEVVVEEAVVEEVDVEEMAVVAYQCPMKCEGDKTYHEKGACPKCKMDLVEVDMDEDHENNNDH